MSPETVEEQNVACVRRWLSALDGGRDGALAAIADGVWDTEGDYYPIRGFPEALPCHGLDAIADFARRFFDAYSHFEWGVQELTPVSDDRVLARVRMVAEGRGSGARIEGDVYECVWVRHGRIFRVEDHLTLRGALDGLGLQGDTLEAAGLGGGASAGDNVERMRDLFAAFDRRDRAAWLALHHPDAEVLTARVWPEADRLADAEAAWDFYLSVADTFERQAFLDGVEPEAAGPDKVLVHQRHTLRGRTSGVDVDFDYWFVVTFADGRIVRDEWFTDADEARAAAGSSG
jgi:ketosteroid isomerase-like protein